MLLIGVLIVAALLISHVTLFPKTKGVLRPLKSDSQKSIPVRPIK